MFIVLSVSVVCLGLIAGGFVRFSGMTGSPLTRIAVALCAGILVDYALMLTGLSLRAVTGIVVVLALVGAVRLWGAGWRGDPWRSGRDPRLVLSVCTILAILGAYYVQILSEPILRWDARSIWFFHAKMIWVSGALRPDAGWSDRSLAFSHPDYPKLVPAIAAQLAFVKGYWNEFLPKASLIVMLLPVLLWVFSFQTASLSFVLLPVLFFASFGAWLWNGYMDGYLALYCGSALLTFGRYLSRRTTADLYSTVLALGIAAGLKNEGQLFAVCFLLVVLACGLASAAAAPAFRTMLRDRQLAAIAAVAIAPTLLWMLWKKMSHLSSEMAGHPADAGGRVLARLFDHASAWHVASYLGTQATALWIMVPLVAFVWWTMGRQDPPFKQGAIVAAATAGLYACALSVVYLSTPYDLEFHLTTSGTRTLAPAMTAFAISIALFAKGRENGSRETPPQ